MCGEQKMLRLRRQPNTGSPPRVRGTADTKAKPRGGGGITPACAGNRNSPSIKGVAAWDHPRVCGEQFTAVLFWMRAAGSPPRVRGTGKKLLSFLHRCGITPACAGNRLLNWQKKFPLEDHPRVCGEQQTQTSSQTMGLGSPPRVRGTAAHYFRHNYASRITPACAGNRGMTTTEYQEWEDHPRVCGEQLPHTQ